MNSTQNPNHFLTGFSPFLFGLIITWLMVLPAHGQKQETDRVAQKEIKKLAFLTGNWEGTGWIMTEDGNRYQFEQTELVQFKLDGTALLIEGRGMREGQIIHDAMAVVTYNHEEENFSFRSWLNTGQGGEFKGELIDDIFYWYIEDNMRYVIYLNTKGQWYEKGEYNTGGDNWFQFFEMTLDKVK